MGSATKFLALFVLLLLLSALGATPGAGQTIPSRSIYAPLILVTGSTSIPSTATPTVQSPTLTPTPTQTPTVTPWPVVTGQVGPCPCDQGDILNCPNFDTQPQAQACFDYCQSLGRGDVHQLDADEDLIACESLPPGWKMID